jgi:hypothetical protein
LKTIPQLLDHEYPTVSLMVGDLRYAAGIWRDVHTTLLIVSINCCEKRLKRASPAAMSITLRSSKPSAMRYGELASGVQSPKLGKLQSR